MLKRISILMLISLALFLGANPSQAIFSAPSMKTIKSSGIGPSELEPISSGFNRKCASALAAAGNLFMKVKDMYWLLGMFRDQFLQSTKISGLVAKGMRPRDLVPIIEDLVRPIPPPKETEATKMDPEQRRREDFMAMMSPGTGGATTHYATRSNENRKYIEASAKHDRAMRLFPKYVRRNLDNPQMYPILINFVENPDLIRDYWPDLYHEIIVHGEDLGFPMRAQWNYYSEIYFDTNTRDGPEEDGDLVGVP